LSPAQRLACGIRAVPGVSTALAATQAAYRFFNNSRVHLRALVDPLIEVGREAVKTACDRYVLAIHDWSSLKIRRQSSPSDRLPESERRGDYELYTTLLVGDRSGDPLAPVALSLFAGDGVHCSRSRDVRPALSPLDELEPAMSFVECQHLGKPVVHIIDAQADSVAHYRRWSSKPERLYLVRADDRIVEHEGKELRCSALRARCREQNAFHHTRDVSYKGQTVQQWVAEAAVRLTRGACQRRGGKKTWIHGPPLDLRLIIAEVRAPEGQVLAVWYLLTNAPNDVVGSSLALWYYWRWRVESYFKLLKSAGLDLEQWGQESAAAVARRLLVASMACVVVWHIARSQHPQADEARQLLVQLSGRQMAYGKRFTEPALLAGIWVLLAMLHTLETYDLDQLREIASIVLPNYRDGPASRLV
jgi:hypothetical protein